MRPGSDWTHMVVIGLLLSAVLGSFAVAYVLG
jgi:hypothetical protein